MLLNFQMAYQVGALIPIKHGAQHRNRELG